jgi:hypothetical protein
MGIVWKPVTFPSRLLTYLVAFLCLGNMVARYWMDFERDEHQDSAWSVASAFVVLGMLALELKLALAGSQYPKHVVGMAKRDPYM